MASLRSLLNLLADQEALLRALLEAPDGLTQTELQARLPAGESVSVGALKRLTELGVVEERPGESLSLELSLAARGFLGQLLRMHELVTPEAIRGYVGEIDAQRQALIAAGPAVDPQAATLALERMAAAIERVRAYANANHAAILERVVATKAGADGYTVRERYLRINALWHDFLGPLRALVEPGEWAHTAFDAARQALADAREAFLAHGVVAEACNRVQARLLRLRTQAGSCYSEGFRELLPLYERARRQNLIAEGCGRWLHALSQRGASGLGRALPIARVQWQGQFSDAALAARLVDMGRHQPLQPPPLGVGEAASASIVGVQRLRAELAAALPVADLLGWLAPRIPDAPLSELVRAYVALAAHGHPVAQAPAHTLERADGRIGYRPLAIDALP